MEHLACNVHYRGRGAENALLSGCLAPAVREQRAAGLARRFWFQRFDARGPHLFVLLGAAPGRADELRAAVDARLRAWMAAHPSTESLTDDELATRHGQCRGKRLCALDAEEGMAANNTLAWTPHPPDGYPYRHTAGTADHDGLWELLSELAVWSIGGLNDATGAALRWIAAVDTELRRAHPAFADACWRRHAASLLPGLGERLERGDDAVLDSLPRMVGARNAATFGAAWRAAEDGDAVWPPLPRLLERVLADDGRTEAARIALVREVNHSVLAQLGQPVALHVPLVLYALSRGRPAAAAAP